MNGAQKNQEKRFPYYIFFVYFGVLLLMSGIHTGFIVLINDVGIYWHVVIRVVIPVLYWAVVAAFLTLYTRRKIKRSYDEPIKSMSESFSRVAKGDFTVRLPEAPRSNSDYLDEIVVSFNKMVEELSGVETLRTDFISNVSHELKTPLSVMQNYGTMLQEPGLPEEKRVEYAKSITEAARRLADLITNILRLNKLENQQIYPNIERYDLSEQLCECLLNFENVWEEKRIDIVTDIEPDVFVECDEQFLCLVWNNLFSNAVKFTPKGGEISVTLETSGGQAIVSVKDTGCGMNEETQKHIFDKFYQGDTSHASQGNGLGLALVKRVVDISNGTVEVKSKQDEGSEFTVRLKCCPSTGE